MLDSERTLTIVMSYAGGSDLLEYVNEHGKFSETETFGYFSQLVYSLEHMHARGFAHRYPASGVCEMCVCVCVLYM